MIRLAVAAALLLTAAPAAASRYAACVVVAGDTRLRSAVVEVPNGDDDAFRAGTFPTEFLAWANATRGIGASKVDCAFFDDLARAEQAGGATATGYRGDRAAPSPAAIDAAVLAEEARKQERQAVDDATRSANRQTQTRFDDQQAENEAAMARFREAQAENERAIARYNDAVAEIERLRRQQMADWQRRVDACRAGDTAQCAPPPASTPTP